MELIPTEMPSQEEFRHACRCLKAADHIILQNIQEAIKHEEKGELAEAIDSYKFAVTTINETFLELRSLPESVMPVYSDWREACSIVKRLRHVREETNYRIRVLQAEYAPIDNDAKEAASEESSNSAQPTNTSFLAENPLVFGKGSVSVTNEELGSIGKNYYRKILCDLRQLMADPERVNLIFDTLFQSQMTLYKIQPDGLVVTMGETSMSLVMCTVQENNSKWQNLNGVCFIQCTIPPQKSDAKEANGAVAVATMSDVPTTAAPHMVWLYALLPAVTDCYRTDYGAFILPDLETDETGHAFGLILLERVDSPDGVAAATAAVAQPTDELADSHQFLLDLLEAVLSGDVKLLKGPAPKRVTRDTSEQVSHNIVGAAGFIARNLVRGAEKTGELMYKSTPYLMSKMQPAAPDAPPVSSSVQTTVAVAKNVTQAAVGVTGWVAGKVGTASVALGRYLAPHVQSAGAALLQKGFGYNSEDANSTLEGAMTIAAGAVEGISTVYDGLETSAKILGNNLSQNSVKIIEYKYGASAGNVAEGTFDTIGNAFNVSQNVNYITPKGIAKKMAKNTGKAVVIDYQRLLRDEEQHATMNSFYKELNKKQ